MFHQKLSYGPLLSSEGALIESGFAYSLQKQYSREAVKARKSRIKEWDYYLISNDFFALALTISDLGYMGADSISFIDFENKSTITKTKMSLFPMGKKNLPTSSDKGLSYTSGKNYEMSFHVLGGERHLFGHMYDFLGKNRPLLFDIVLSPSQSDSIVMATPFKNKKCFYYNQKINCLTADGRVIVDGREYLFSTSSSMAVLDWGRGVWPYQSTTWYWSSLSAFLDHKHIGFNLGYGFGTNPESENVIFVDGKAHKLGEVRFVPSQKGSKILPDAPWQISDDRGFLNLVFTPIVERRANSNFLFIKSLQSQVFGEFSGYMKLENGSIIQISQLKGFLEKVTNKW